MKQLIITNPTHERIEKAFGEWLKVMGYASTSVYSLPLHVREFFYWIESQQKRLEKLSPEELEDYFFHLKTRPCKRKTGTMSTGNLHKHRQALKRLSYYLKETGQAFLDIDVHLPEQPRKLKQILTKSQIQRLYDVCESTPLGIRDRAMLAVFYGCGLRRSEGIGLNVSDILTERNLLYIRHGKHYRERYTPMTAQVKQEIENYVHYARPSLLKDTKELSFFVSERGARPQGQSLYLRLKKLTEKAGFSDLLHEPIGLHHLRHSIATHLLQSGMKLSHIAKFLGHESIESTQIYTQLVNETE